MKTTEGNKLIAEFMRQESMTESEQDSYGYNPQDFTDDLPNYDLSWDWLMPVVEKIESLGYFCMINKWTSVYAGSKDSRLSITAIEGKSKIKNTHEAVVEFIQWYNLNKAL